jgi:hypothetical protein
MSVSFKSFIFRQHAGKTAVVFIIIVIQFIVLKILYPFAMFSYDSANYVDVAMRNAAIDVRPVAYSKILLFLHMISPSDWAVVIFQYMLLEGALFYFYFTLLYMFRPGKWISWIMLMAFFLNTFVASISNYIMSDAIFTGMTVIWFTLTLWFLYRPRDVYAYMSILLLVVLFMIRYYAIYYPLITVVIILSSGIRWKAKVYSLILGCLLFGGYVWYTGEQYRKLLGRWEFSPFGGWQIASNALIMCHNMHAENYSSDIPPPELQSLHRHVVEALVFTRQKNMHPSALCVHYMWQEGPLWSYMALQYPNLESDNWFKEWASMGHLYRQYGNYLIMQHPLEYVRYYIGEGLYWYVVPTMEFSNISRSGRYVVDYKIKRWFNYPSAQLSCTMRTYFSMWPYLNIIFILNVCMVISTILFFICRCYKLVGRKACKAIMFAAGFWVVNFLFSIISSPMALRYAISVMVLDIGFVMIQVEWICRKIRLA